MLDENLPAFHFKPSSDNPYSTLLYFTHNGSEPTAEYVLRRPDRARPESRHKYAIALCDPINPGVVYGETLIEPEWSQPTLSAAELRAQQQNGAGPAPATPITPDSFTIQLYDPDLSILVKMVSGSWGKNDSWEFEVPTQSFRLPTTSQLDREQGKSAAAAELTPKLMFRWKRDGRLSKDMSCFMTGRSVGGSKSKEPDITVAMFKAARDSSVVTVYEPNMQRVEVEDRKGWEVVLLLAAEAVKDLYLAPRQDPFNVSGSAAPSPAANAAGKKTARTSPPPPPSQPNAAAPATSSAAYAVPAAASTPEIEAETRRLKAMVEREEKAAKEREKRDVAEQKRIRKMLDDEEKEQSRRTAEIDMETERLRREFGMEGQMFSAGGGSNPTLPPRPQGQSPSPPFGQRPPPPGSNMAGPSSSSWFHPTQGPPAQPPRPASVGPAAQQQPQGSMPWYRGSAASPPPQQDNHRREGVGLGLHNPGGGLSGFFGRAKDEDKRNKVQKKKSF